MGLDPVPAPPHVFALDRGELAYGCFHNGPQGYVFETSRREPLPDDLFTDGVLGAPMREPRVFWEILQDFAGHLPGPIKEASLVLPDTWLRLAFTESEELPSKARARQDILRFKLKRLVPFRVEELRITAVPVTPYPNQEAPERLLLGFGVEALLAQLERAFAGIGIEIGRVTNTTLALLASLQDTTGPDELAALVLARPGAFTLSYVHQGEPLLYRFKSFGDEPSEAVSENAVRRDLRLTRNFVHQHFPERPLGRLFLAAAPADEERWLDWLTGELEVEPEPLDFDHFPLVRTQAGESWLQTAPLLGAARLEVR